MNEYTIIIYDEGDHSYDRPIVAVDIRANDYEAAEEVAALMFNNTGRVLSLETKESNDA